MNNTNKILRILSIPILISFFYGCGSTVTEFRKFNGYIDDSVEGGTFQRVGGSNILLEIYQFSDAGFLFPTAWAGRSFFIEAPPDVLQQNRIIEIPNKRIKTFYYRDYHHLGSLKKDLSGKIKIIEISGDYIFAHIKLKVDGTDIKINFKEKFINTDIIKYDKIER